MKLIFRGVLVTVLVSEAVLLILKRIKPEVSNLWFLAPIILLAVALFVLFSGMWRDYRRSGNSWAASLTITSKRFGVPRKALAFLVAEVSSLASVFSLFRPVRSSSSDDQIYTAYRNLRTLIFAILGVSVAEIIIVHLAVSNDFWRYLVVAVSIYAVVLLCGFYASIRNRPHLLTSRGIVIRYGKRLTCEIPWSHLKSISYVGAGNGGDITVDENGQLRIPVLSEVNLRLEVEPQVVVEDLQKGLMKVSSIELYCDEKEQLMEDIVQRRSSIA